MSMPKKYPEYEVPDYEEWWIKLNSVEKKKIMQLYSPKKVTLGEYVCDSAGYGTLIYRCPRCNRTIDIWYNNCPDCGQKLNWRVKS